ncbi:MAG: uroporphyrinogen decarboxylase family protein [Anaerolineae bacterium]
MTAKERVLAALRFERADRQPIYDSFWDEFVEQWRILKGLPPSADIADYYGIDLDIVIPDETPFPSRRQVLSADRYQTIERDGWGAIKRTRAGAKFEEVLAVALPEKPLLDALAFEPADADARFPEPADVAHLAAKRCLFVKTGGPYLRTSNLRGTTQWLIDLVEDESFARQLAMKVTEHMTAVGLEAIRRYQLCDTGIWFFDDMGANQSPMFSPRTFERVLLPCYEWMCRQYAAAGVAHILLHCDGNIEPILDMLVAAGVQGLHPIEPKAGMDVVKLRQRYGKSLALLGGLDNARILLRGDRDEIHSHVLHVLEAGREGGLVIGAHSIGPDVSVETYDFVHDLILSQGTT